jgi:hypothetical protein
MLGKRSARTYLKMGTAALAVILLVTCHKALPPDGVCSYEPLPAGAQVPSGQGGIQVLASTAYFAVRDTTGKQTASEHVNAITPVPPGDYQVVLNGSTPFHLSPIEDADQVQNRRSPGQWKDR